MASTGNQLVATGENNAGIGATAWSNPGNIVSDNGTDATCSAGASSQYLVGRNAPLTSVPTSATINGITVRAEASEHSAGTESLNAQLQNDSGTLIGSSKANTISGTTKAVYTYGGTADLWGATLTANIIHDADFGVRFWFTTAHDVRVDYVTIAVEYTVPGPGIATETDAALNLGRVKIKAVGVATETDTALALGASKVRAAGVSTETDTALALGVVKARAAGTATETDVALGPGRAVAVGVALETDTAINLGRVKARATGRADETDTALALAQGSGGIPVGRADETDAALALGMVKLRTVQTATETDAGFGLGAIKVRAVTTATETDTALELGRVKARDLGAAIETDTALALGGALRVGMATETDTALALSPVLPIVTNVDASVVIDVTVRNRRRVVSRIRKTITASDVVDVSSTVDIVAGFNALPPPSDAVFVVVQWVSGAGLITLRGVSGDMGIALGVLSESSPAIVVPIAAGASIGIHSTSSGQVIVGWY